MLVLGNYDQIVNRFFSSGKNSYAMSHLRNPIIDKIIIYVIDFRG